MCRLMGESHYPKTPETNYFSWVRMPLWVCPNAGSDMERKKYTQKSVAFGVDSVA